MTGSLLRTLGAWKHALVLGCLLALLTYIFNESRDVDRQSRRHILDVMRTLQLHDAQFSRDVLMARGGQLPDYDALMQDRQNLLQDLVALAEASARTSRAAADVVRGHQVALEGAVRDKLRQVERFKSDNALTRNSLMYLTRWVEDDPEAKKLSPLESARLQQSLLRFVETLDSNAAAQIRAELDRLAGAFTRTSMPLLLAHGRLIVNVLPGVDSLLNEITSPTTAGPAKELEAALMQYDRQAEARAQVLRYALYFFSVVLFGYLVHQFVTIRSSATSLSEANTGLQLEMAERAQAEIALRTSEERYRAMTHSAKEAIITVDPAGHIVSWNLGAAIIFGREAEEVMNKPLSLLMPRRLRRAPGQTFLHWRDSDASKAWEKTVECSGIRNDGAEIALEISRSRWSTAQGEFETGVIRDISERKQLEETTRQQEMQLIQANKMTSLGTLVMGAAHDIDQPNQSIMNNSESLSNAWADALEVLDQHAQEHGSYTLGNLPYAEMRERMAALTGDIDIATRHIGGIVKDLKDFGRGQQPGAGTTLRVNEAIGRTLRLLRWRIDQLTTRFQVQLAEPLPLALGDSGQIEQILVNLLSNALEALPDRSHGVSVSSTLAPDGQKILVVVQDEGKGIAPDHLARIYEPFFTTKQASGGTGMGLAISASLAQANGARLDYSSELGRGTRATLALRCTGRTQPQAG